MTLTARAYTCEKGCRVSAVWTVPTMCRVKLGRNRECGLPLFPIGVLPLQAQRAVNPLKASKAGARSG